MLGLTLIATAVTAAKLSIQPSNTVTGPEGAFFSLDIHVGDVTDLYALQFDLNYDSTILTVERVTDGIPRTDDHFFIPGLINAGKVTYTANTLLGSVSGISGEATVAQLNFQALELGTTPITLDNVVLLDSNGTELATTLENANVIIAVPTMVGDLDEHAGCTYNNSIAIDPDSKPIERPSCFQGHISVSGNTGKNMLAKPDDYIEISYSIWINENYIGKSGQVLILAQHQQGKNQNFFFRDEQLNWHPWDKQIGSLKAAQTITSFPTVLELDVYAGKGFLSEGEFKIYVGYRPDDGNIIYTSDPVRLFVSD